MVKQLRRSDLLYPDLSYEILGCCFHLYNELGCGHKELYYQNALARALEKVGLHYEREKRFDLLYDDRKVGTYVVDLLIEEKVVVELKVRPKMGYVHINQMVSYLKASEKRLAILVYFLQDGVRYRRIVVKD